MDISRRFWGFRQNGRPVFHLGDYIREQSDNVAGYSAEFGKLDPEEKPAPADCCGVSICLRCNDLGSEVGPFPGIYDNRPGRGHIYLVADPGPALAARVGAQRSAGLKS